ncbi:MAG: ribosome recycling factor [Bacilli bacterium]
MTEILIKAEEKMVKALNNLDSRFHTIRAGRANPVVFDNVSVNYYDSPTPLKSLATINVTDGRTMILKPYDKTTISLIEKAIFESNLGFTPNNNGESIIITVPQLTEERRHQYVKQVKTMAEDAKVAIRNIRQDAISTIKKGEESDDNKKELENDVQSLVEKFNKSIETKFKEKEKELLTI